MKGVETSKNETRYRWLVVSNDGTDEVISGLQCADFQWLDYRYPGDPSHHYIRRVYSAWNAGVMNAPTQWVILANSDMLFSDWAIDELMYQKQMNKRSLPCSLLVENGRIPSGMPDFVRDFGTAPDTFRTDDFLRHADSIRQRRMIQPGRLFQPVLFDRQEFLDMGGYPEQGNIGGLSGDRALFDRYVNAGFSWVTCLGSVVAHCQEGEMRCP
jgi:hypothetical protein